MADLKLWGNLYQELAELFSNGLEMVEWIDLWHNQVSFLVEEHPFPSPALFLGFRILNAEDEGRHMQKLLVQVDVYYFYETFLDTFNGAYNKTDALAYLNTVTDIHALLHGKSGTYFSEAKRTGFAPVDTGSAGNLYRQSFSMLVEDYSASPVDGQAIPGEVDLGQGTAPEPQERPGGFLVT